jgi:hypothetical protein
MMAVYQCSRPLSSGALAGCGGVFVGDCDALQFGSVHDQGFRAALQRVRTQPLSTLIHRLGLGAVKAVVEANSDLRFDKRYVNRCHLCGDIMTNPAAVDVLRRVGFLDLAESRRS